MNVCWYFGGIATGAAVGWLAALCHSRGWAPVGLLPLAVGIVSGFALSRLAAAGGVCCLKRLVLGALICALAAIVIEHTWLYLDFRRQWAEARATDANVALFRPETPWSPAEYFRHEFAAGRLTLWSVDGALTIAATVGAVLALVGACCQQVVVADDANASDS